MGTYQGNQPTHNSSWNTWPQSSQLTELLWTDLGPKSGIGVRKLFSTSRKKKKVQAGNDGRTVSQTPRTCGKRHHAQESTLVYLISHYTLPAGKTPVPAPFDQPEQLNGR